VEFDALAQFEFPGQVADGFPGNRQARFQVLFAVLFDRSAGPWSWVRISSRSLTRQSTPNRGSIAPQKLQLRQSVYSFSWFASFVNCELDLPPNGTLLKPTNLAREIFLKT
jgi:hypothetical protein